MAQINMFAPTPFFHVSTRGSRHYHADSQGWIQDVDGRDIGDLRRSGCIDEEEYNSKVVDLVKPVTTLVRAKSAPKNLLVPKPESDEE